MLDEYTHSTLVIFSEVVDVFCSLLNVMRYGKSMKGLCVINSNVRKL